MEPKGTLGPRLRQERERRQISLASIASNTKISESLLEALERDDVRRWPSGIFRRAFVRSYATAIGMDADEIWKEFSERFPDPSAPPAAAAAATAAASKPEPEASAISTRTETNALPDRIEFVFRVSVPRSWVNWAMRMKSLASRVPTLHRQDM
jgi:transcriptional regulator with XRE-family HTH domain